MSKNLVLAKNKFYHYGDARSKRSALKTKKVRFSEKPVGSLEAEYLPQYTYQLG